jgi:N-acetylneuraminate synthase
MKKINLNGKLVGDDEPVYFIAEIAGNFSTFREAKKLIDSAVSVGCNAVKFQTFEADTATTKKNMFDMDNVGKVPQYKLLKESECPKDIQKDIIKYCNKNNILAFSAPSHIKDIEFMEEFGNPIYKIGSDLACHIPALKIIARLKKPIILSTGMCTLEEVKKSVSAILAEGNDQIILMHCVADYPTKYNEVNLKAIKTMQKEFEIPVGYSDHTIGPEISLAAVAMGAHLIEKHFKHSENIQGPDAILSSNEQEMKYIIDSCRKIEQAKGSGIKEPSKTERKNMINNRVSICSLKDILKGTIITEDMIDIKRPGSGIQPIFFDQVVGKSAKKDIFADEPITWDMI